MFTAVVTSHRNIVGLTNILANLRNQTRPPDQVILVVSNADSYDLTNIFKYLPKNSLIVVDEDRNDWGHNKRAIGLSLATGEYVGFFNDDDSYDKEYIEAMMLAITGGDADVAYCYWDRVCTFDGGSSTSGNFIVRTKLAKKVGWNQRDYAADAQFINDIKKEANGIVRVEEHLYHHNRQ